MGSGTGGRALVPVQTRARKRVRVRRGGMPRRELASARPPLRDALHVHRLCGILQYVRSANRAESGGQAGPSRVHMRRQPAAFPPPSRPAGCRATWSESTSARYAPHARSVTLRVGSPHAGASLRPPAPCFLPARCGARRPGPAGSADPTSGPMGPRQLCLPNRSGRRKCLMRLADFPSQAAR